MAPRSVAREGGAPRPRIDSRLARRGGSVELLRVPSLLFGAAARLRGLAYDRGLLPATRLDVPVVSVGNLTAGGTGKTPFVALLAGELRARGRRPGVASRGYGARRGDPDRENDEARLLARAVPDVPLRQDPDRVAAALALVEAGCDCVVLDDGFQHRRLARDLDLVLVDATRPWGLPAPPTGGTPVRALLPRGLLREPPAALARAHALVLTRADQVPAEARDALEAELQRLAPGVPVVTARHRPARIALTTPAGPVEHPPEALAGRSVDLLSAIGNPEAFQRTVESLGARVAAHRRFPDHHRYVPADLDGLGVEDRWIVTTEKDAVKLAHFPAPAPLAVLGIELALERGAPVLEALLDALPRGPAAHRRASLHAGLSG